MSNLRMNWKELWKGFDYETYIPHINVRLNDPATGDEFKREVENYLVHEVMMESHLMAFMTSNKGHRASGSSFLSS